MASISTFIDKIKGFYAKYPILSNLILVVAATALFFWFLSTVFLGIWTRHGHTTSVPSVKGMSVIAAEQALRDGGFDVELDSIYDKTAVPGSVVEQSPHPNTVVKEGRTIYLIYTCYNPKLIKVPQYYNMSRRQAIASFEEIGFLNLTIKEVPSEHADLVIGAKYNGLPLRPGAEIPANASVVLEVGAGMGDDRFDDDVYEELVLPEDEDAEFINELDLEMI